MKTMFAMIESKQANKRTMAEMVMPDGATMRAGELSAPALEHFRLQISSKQMIQVTQWGDSAGGGAGGGAVVLFGPQEYWRTSISQGDPEDSSRKRSLQTKLELRAKYRVVRSPQL